ncbi:DNA-binding NarL/FixJ family response regulator [Albidovulum inexpectatum]|uniref:DNA-binding NarL/FixJ family response regulator n=2 Tax=Albidovulum inexpectatum TaxID=196587 RepID=A0A2S5JII4_9RHOB|nr:DNA-binding NarL/FixJ family response regulator [Albidovulum inexpectatum]
MKSDRDHRSGGAGTDRVLFIGSALAFPEVTLRLVRAEFEGVEVSRFDTIEQAIDAGQAASVRMVVLDQKFTEDLADIHDLARSTFGNAHVVLAYDDVSIARPVFQRQQAGMGLSGLRFIPMHSAVGSWISILRLLMAGEVLVPGDLIQPFAMNDSMNGAADASGNPSLTRREIEVLRLVAQGHRNKTIAAMLDVSEHTVKLHIHHLMRKIGVGNRTAAANWFMQNGHAGDEEGPA